MRFRACAHGRPVADNEGPSGFDTVAGINRCPDCGAHQVVFYALDIVPQWRFE